VPPTIDVVIPVYNRFDLTEDCLHHLERQTLAHRVIVVDNGSTDETCAGLREKWPSVMVERFNEGRGFAEACNRGAAAGEGDVIVLLNNDVNCRANFLERLVAPLESDSSAGSVAALMLQPGEALIDSIGLAADATLACFPRLRGNSASLAERPRPVLAGPAGTAAAYRRVAWEQVGGLDETIFAYMEDFDLALRLQTAGWHPLVAPDAVGVHLGSASHGHRSASQRRHAGFGRGYLLRRYGLLSGRAAPRVLATEVIVVIGDLLVSRDAAGLQGRVAGWRAAGPSPRLPKPPRQAVDWAISFRQSLPLRRGVYDPASD
jgi:N-acetylglucosaminyl-diphospho-decaprenol L-rhamnosyltransferase